MRAGQAGETDGAVKGRGLNPTDRDKVGVRRSRITEAQDIPVKLSVDGTTATM